MASGPTHIVDASAVIAYFKQEAGYENFSSLLVEEQNILAIHATNLCEVYYGYLRSDGPDKAEEAWQKASAILGVIEKIDAQFIKRVGGRFSITCHSVTRLQRQQPKIVLARWSQPTITILDI